MKKKNHGYSLAIYIMEILLHNRDRPTFEFQWMGLKKLDFFRFHHVQGKTTLHTNETHPVNIPILPMAFLTFAEAKVGSAPPFV